MIFAAPRCSEIPELVSLKNIFEKKYGKDFVSAAVDLRPSCGVNRQVSPLLNAILLVFAKKISSVLDFYVFCIKLPIFFKSSKVFVQVL